MRQTTSLFCGMKILSMSMSQSLQNTGPGKKIWAFVSDYIRLHALYTQGGIYLDTDMELLKPLDPLLQHKAFLGFEGPADDENLSSIEVGCMGSVKGHMLFKQCMKVIEENYLRDNIQYKILPSLMNNEIKHLRTTHPETIDAITFFPLTYFSPLYPFQVDEMLAQHARSAAIERVLQDRKEFLTTDTYTMHWYRGSWHKKRLYLRLCLTFLKKIAKKIGIYPALHFLEARFKKYLGIWSAP